MRRLAIALAGGIAVALSLPPWGWWPLSFVGIALLTVAADRPAPAVRRRARLATGSAFGLGWLAMGMAWMWQLTAPGFVAASLIFALLHGLAELAVPTGPGRLVGRAAAHTLVEALRFSFPFGGVPLASLGIAQAAGPVGAIARVGGVIAITWVVFQAGGALAALVLDRAAWRHPAVALGACGLVLVAGFVGPRGRDTGETLDVAVVQGGGEQGTRAIDVPSRIVTERHLAATRTIEPDPDLDLVLWPENVIDTADFLASEHLASIAVEAARLDVPFAVGVTEDVPDQPGKISNAQVIVTPDGEVTSRYDKVRRVPFGEYVPLRGLLEALGAPVDQVPTNAVAGTTPAVIDTPEGTRLAVVISWEVFFGGRAREGVKEGGELVINPTNGASYTGTIVQTQQVASSRLRAIETGRWVAQAAPTGFSGFMDPDGGVHDRTAVSEQAVIRRELPLREGRTWYLSIGDGPWIVAVGVAFAAAWAAGMTTRRGRTLPT